MNKFQHFDNQINDNNTVHIQQCVCLPGYVTDIGLGYRTLWPQETSASRQSGTLRHRSQETSTPKTWYETLRHDCRDRGKAGTLRLRTISMRLSSTGDSA